MVLPRPSMFRAVLWAQTKRTCGVRARSRIRQQLGGRRTYASGGDHGHSASEGSDIPWMIGSVGVTAPAAYYLLQSSPDIEHSHGTGHGNVVHTDEEADPLVQTQEGGEKMDDEGNLLEEKDSEETKSDDSGSEGGDEAPKDTPETSEDEGGDKGGDDEDDEPDPESVKGQAKVEGPGVTQANHPTDPHDNPKISKKAEGVVDTARIHGTVDASKRRTS